MTDKPNDSAEATDGRLPARACYGSADYRRGYSAGYQAGCKRREKEVVIELREKPLPVFDKNDPVVIEGYEATNAGDNRNPYPTKSSEYCRFNQGCWVAWGMATFCPPMEPYDDNKIEHNAAPPLAVSDWQRFDDPPNP